MSKHQLLAELRGARHILGGTTVCRSLTYGQPLLLIREPHNRYDKNAIRVATLYGVRFAYLAKEVAAIIAPEIDQGFTWMAKVNRECPDYKPGRRKFPEALLWREESEDDEKYDVSVPRQLVLTYDGDDEPYDRDGYGPGSDGS